MLAKILRRRFQGLNKLEKEDIARKWKRRLSIAYMLIGWNMLTYTIYHYFSDRFPKVNRNIETGERYQDILDFEKIKKAKVIRFQGFTKIQEYDLVNKNDVVEEEQPEI